MILDAFPRRKLRWQTCEAAGLPNSAILCDCCLMNSYRFISRLLAVLVIAGLVATPLVAPAAAKRLPVAVTMDMPGMAADMPCCQAARIIACHFLRHVRTSRTAR